MRISTLITPAIFLALIAAPGCKEQAPTNEPGEFGDPCVIGEDDNTPDGCMSGLSCYFGYCEETCASPSDCQPVDGWEHTCAAGVCHISCTADDPCPESLGTSLFCATNNRCKAEEYE